MKLHYVKVLIAVAAITFNSCAREGFYSSYQKKMLVDDGKTFLEKRNGEKIYGNKIKVSNLRHLSVQGVTWIAIDGVKYADSLIAGYQDKSGYYKQFIEEPVKRLFKKDKVDVYSYLPQIKRGKINLYQYDSELTPKTQTQSATYITAYRMQKGNADWGEYFYAGKVRDFIKDNPKALAYFNAVFKKDKERLDKHPKELLQTIDLYNEN